jgi:hypothetical protein
MASSLRTGKLVPMSQLFVRTLSQGLQAFLPLAVGLAWYRRNGRSDRVAAIYLGIAGAVAATPVVGYWFQHTDHQARWEALLAITATVMALCFGLQIWRGHAAPRWSKIRLPHPLTRQFALAAASILIVVRQTMEIDVVLKAALIDLRSLEATAAICGGVTLAFAIAWTFTRVCGRLPERAFTYAAGTFAGVFLAQATIYAFHESAEARFLPWSDVLHEATEVYGPDGTYGLYVSYLLIALPVLGAVWTLIPARVRSGFAKIPRVRVAGLRPARLATVVAGTACLMLMGPDVGGVAMSRARARSTESARDVANIVAGPHVLFRHTGRDSDFGKLAATALASPGASRAAADLLCERVSFAGGRGICLQARRGLFTTSTAVVFDASLASQASIRLEGSPSRARVSPDGRVGAFSVFVSGHGYANTTFSTKTTLIDMATADVLGDLEQFTTWRDGARFRATDVNFWGVTFARDSNTFYASLRTGGATYLVKGELGLRKLTVLRDNVECPSLSPGNRLIAFKRRVGPQLDSWRLFILDLATMTDRPIAAETRYIDDQVEWLDETHVLYAIRHPDSDAAILDVWVAPIDAATPARLFLERAESPIVVR